MSVGRERETNTSVMLSFVDDLNCRYYAFDISMLILMCLCYTGFGVVWFDKLFLLILCPIAQTLICALRQFFNIQIYTKKIY